VEVHFKADVQAKLGQMARESGRPSDELVEDALIVVDHDSTKRAE
jgi:hypothetical protein